MWDASRLGHWEPMLWSQNHTGTPVDAPKPEKPLSPCQFEFLNSTAFVSCSTRTATDGSPAGGACYAHATIFFAPSGELNSLLQMMQHVPPVKVSQRWLTAVRHSAPHQ